MADKPVLNPDLWKDRSVAETLAVYRDWAAAYDADVRAEGYVTPDRIAAALLPLWQGRGPILDFGCGTGFSGEAFARAGLGPLHGTDITPQMLDMARSKGIYDLLWQGEPGVAPCKPGDYPLIIAAGVVSLGAAPPETLSLLIDSLAVGGLLALSFNDPTVADGRYDAVLTAELGAARVRQLFRENGPHLSAFGMGSDVIVLCRV